MPVIPYLPESAPFSAAQRQWLNGYLAGLLSDADAAGGALAGGGPLVTGAEPKLKVPVLWGSQSGNSEGLAEEIGERLAGAGFEAPVSSMEEFEALGIGELGHLLLVTSTWGEGDPPDNAAAFLEWLEGEAAPRLEGLKYSVLALGDSNYLDFCGAGKRFDVALEKLGATRLAERVDCDVDFEDAAKGWTDGVLAGLELRPVLH